MGYYDALIAKWATLQGSTDEKLAAINALTVAGPKKDVPVSEVTAYLLLHLKLASLQSYALNPPQGAVAGALAAAQNLVAFFKLPEPPAFRTSDPVIYATCRTALEAIASDPLSGLSPDDAAAMIGIADSNIPWWKASVEQGGGGLTSPVSASDLEAAGGLV